MPAFLRPHGGQNGAGHLGRGEEVDFHLLAQLLGREFLDRAKRAAPGDVGEHVDTAETSERGVDGSQARVRVRHVERDRERRLSALGRQRLKRRRPPSRQDGASPRLRTASASARPKPLEAPVMNQTRCMGPGVSQLR